MVAEQRERTKTQPTASENSGRPYHVSDDKRREREFVRARREELAQRRPTQWNPYL